MANRAKTRAHAPIVSRCADEVRPAANARGTLISSCCGPSGSRSARWGSARARSSALWSQAWQRPRQTPCSQRMLACPRANASCPEPSPGSSDPAARERPPIAIRRTRLDNGLRVVLSRDTSLPTVAICVTYDVGSRNEGPGERGFAGALRRALSRQPAPPSVRAFRRLARRAGARERRRLQRVVHAQLLAAQCVPGRGRRSHAGAAAAARAARARRLAG
jgi:hypothetical protein